MTESVDFHLGEQLSKVLTEELLFLQELLNVEITRLLNEWHENPRQNITNILV